MRFGRGGKRFAHFRFPLENKGFPLLKTGIQRTMNAKSKDSTGGKGGHGIKIFVAEIPKGEKGGHSIKTFVVDWGGLL